MRYSRSQFRRSVADYFLASPSYTTIHFEIDIHTRMASLDEEITALKAEIEGYELRLNDITSHEDKLVWAGLIKSRSDSLTELQ